MTMRITSTLSDPFENTPPTIYLDTSYKVYEEIGLYNLTIKLHSPCELIPLHYAKVNEIYQKNTGFPYSQSLKNFYNDNPDNKSITPKEYKNEPSLFDDNWQCEQLWNQEVIEELNYFYEQSALESGVRSVTNQKKPFIKNEGNDQSKDKTVISIKPQKIIDEQQDNQWKYMVRQAHSRGKRQAILGEVVGKIGIVAATYVATNIINFFSQHLSRKEDLGKQKEAFGIIDTNFEQTGKLIDLQNVKINYLDDKLRRLEAMMSNNLIDEHRINFINSLIMTKISRSSMYLKRVVHHAINNKVVNTEALNQMFERPIVLEADDSDTVFQSVENHDDPTHFTMMFIIKKRSKSTKIYKVHGFTHWDKILINPVLLTYTGPKFVLANLDINCIKAYDEPEETGTTELCNTPDLKEIETNTWTQDTTTSLSLDKLIPKPQVKYSLLYSYIYCFPGNITIEDKTSFCPSTSFKLPITTNFSIDGLHHVTSKITLTVKDAKFAAVDSIHLLDSSHDYLNERQSIIANEQYRTSYKRVGESLVIEKPKTNIWLWCICTLLILTILSMIHHAYFGTFFFREFFIMTLTCDWNLLSEYEERILEEKLKHLQRRQHQIQINLRNLKSTDDEASCSFNIEDDISLNSKNNLYNSRRNSKISFKDKSLNKDENIQIPTTSILKTSETVQNKDTYPALKNMTFSRNTVKPVNNSDLQLNNL